MSGLKLLLDKNRLTGPNYEDWLRNLNLALTYDKVHYVTVTKAPEELSDDSTEADKAIMETWEKDCLHAKCLILASMDNIHQKKYEKMDIRSIFLHAKELYGEQSRSMRYDLSQKFFHARMAATTSVGDHVLKMIGWIEELANLGFILDNELYTDIILQSLPSSYTQFISNFNMNNLNPSLPELLNILRVEESTRARDKTALLVEGSSCKVKPNKKIKKKPQQKQKTAKGKGKAPEEGEDKGKKKAAVTCFFCGKKGHIKSQCRKFLAHVATLKENPVAAVASGVFVVENCLSISTESWVLDTGSGSHICNSLQGLRRSRRLGTGEMDLRVGNDASTHAVGDYHLSLPKGNILILKNCYFVPNMMCNIISVSVLTTEGYVFGLRDDVMNVMKDRILVANGTLSNGIYILDQNSLVLTTQNTKKRNASGMNDSYLWHCRLGHISKNRLDKLHKDGLIDPYSYETYDTCHSCIKGKMTKTPFIGKGARVEELLGLIHSDVCGPMSTHARGGYSYFVTFIDDFSRFGYVYLIKNKSEVFEKFVEYKTEVEKQLGKSIKCLRSDRGGEYLSSEFLTFMKDHGILSQLTPPYTPQHNGVAERRNRTLLDMVRSMMCSVELPLSFWGYALETASYLSNRLPSKSVSSTPYQLWYSRKPSFNHIKPWGCSAFVRKQDPSKLETRAIVCKFVGYPRNTKGYTFYQPDEQRIVISRNATFLERDFC